MQVQTGVIAFRSPTGEFIDDEPIFDDVEETMAMDNEHNPLDIFVNYIVSRGFCLNDK